MNYIIMILVVTVLSLGGVSYANETSPTAMANNENPPDKVAISRYAQGVDASHQKDYQKALPLLQEALKEDPNNPDILNMLAHAQRETGDIDDALVNYKRALELRPKFPEAHEYLGETYMQAALQEVETLKSYGTDGQEQLEILKKDIKQAVDKL